MNVAATGADNDSDEIRDDLVERGIEPVIPPRSNRKTQIEYDREAYKRRNLIERCVNRLKQFRRIATRYEKTARAYPPHSVDAAKQLLADSGYAGEPVILMAAQDIAHMKAWGDVTVDLLKRLDMKVDLAAVDFGTVIAGVRKNRRPAKAAGRCFLLAIMASTVPTRPTGSFALTAMRAQMVGRIIRKSKPKSQRGIIQRAWTRRRRLYAGSTDWPSIMSSSHRYECYCGIMLGARMSAALCKRRCPFSGA